MNAGFDRHFTAEVLEEYALGIQSEEDCTSLEEHLLICSACQDLLAETDEYIQAVKTAAALLASQNGEGNAPVSSSSMRRRWSKPMATAETLA